MSTPGTTARTTGPSADRAGAGRTGPRDVAVVGSGVVGLSTAWFLQARGVEVTVYDAEPEARPASWGNAGWLTPGLTAPLPEPAVLRYGLRSITRPTSPVYVPVRPDPTLWRFLAGFARHCTDRRWRSSMQAYAGLNRRALRAFDDLADAGATARPRPARPFLACYRTTQEATSMLEELARIEAAGQRVHFEYLTGPQVRQAQPAVSDEVGAAVLLHGQRYLHPPRFLASLEDAVRGAGGEQRPERVVDVDVEPNAAWVVTDTGRRHRHEAVVLATGSGLGGLARGFGVRRLVHPGRGYSFTVTGTDVPRDPVYFPHQRVACTPLHEPVDGGEAPDGDADLLRVAGMMEFRRAGEPLDERRLRAIVEAVRPFLPGVDLDARWDEWVGSRPCTTDGLPLVGATVSSRVFVAGGHGMWGVALGPLTGQLLAEQITTGRTPDLLRPLDPLR
ncbi:NAD(P)/FAD-dependent oxidoreductase [Nocardioides dongxiaopingii]|uniref:NAD(P)/FAD-dependent oxidoreductase n=1 Tax=Nocardioides dongxiaopingii TaxID=2576036 RepID=UPI0010C76993|nr:FAD-binding oxidoreductase [Nocardioides dongxiaopingii]